jgi:hypothetical protein
METQMAEATTTAQTNTEAATEAKAEPSTMLGESAPASQNVDAAKVDGEAKTDEAKADDVPAAPEKYEFKLPDGYTLDEEAFKVFEPGLRELNLTNESAQKLVEKYAEVQKIQSEAAEKAFNDQVEKWAEDVKADKELGGQAFEASRSSALKAVGKFGSPELKSLLNQTGLGNHPEFVRFCARVGKSLREDDPMTASKATSGKSAAEVLYGNS